MSIVDDFFTNTSSPQGTRRRLSSSVLTPIFKYGVSGTLILSEAVVVYLVLTQGPIDFSLVQLPFHIALVLWFTHLLLRLKTVTAYDEHLTIGNQHTGNQVPYDDIEEVRVSRGRNVFFVRLTLREESPYGDKIHFVLPSRLGQVEAQPEIQLLRDKCPRLSEVSKSRWLRTLYLRPPNAQG